MGKSLADILYGVEGKYVGDENEDVVGQVNANSAPQDFVGIRFARNARMQGGGLADSEKDDTEEECEVRSMSSDDAVGDSGSAALLEDDAIARKLEEHVCVCIPQQRLDGQATSVVGTSSL